MPICMPGILSRAGASRNLQNACACEMLALACRHGDATRTQAARSRSRPHSTRSPVPCAPARRPGGTPRACRQPCASASRRSPRRRRASSRRPIWRARSRVLDVSMSEAGRLFGVSRSAVEQWLQRGVPAARLARAANLARIADILERNLKPERIAGRGARAGRGLRRHVDPRAGARRAATTRRASCSSGRSTGRARPDAARRARRDLRARRRRRLGGSAGRLVLAARGGGRWNAPGTFAVLYLCRDVETARANARRLLEGQPFTFDDLLPERLPALVETTVPEARYVDAVTARGLASLELPATYPLRRARQARRHDALPGRSARPPGTRASRASRAAAPRPARPPAARSSRSSTAAGACGAAAAAASTAGTAAPEPRLAPRRGPPYDRVRCSRSSESLAGILQLVAGAPYVRDILRGTTRPQRATWTIWTTLSFVVLASQWASGATWSLVLMVGQARRAARSSCSRCGAASAA